MMFKIIASVLLLISCLIADAQTDSTKNNLQRHKELFEQGLITEQEYEMLKKKELNLLNEPAKASQNDTIKPQQFKSKLVIGSIGLGTGISMVVSGFVLKDKVKIVQGNSTGALPNVIEYKKQARVLFITGTLFSGLGIAFLAKGARLRNKYFDAQIAGNSVSLRVNF